MKVIDLNCDMGELQPGQSENNDADIMPYVSSCNVAYGFYSSAGPLLLSRTIQAAMAAGVSIGAHPSYKDPENFGRVSVQVDREVLMKELRYQVMAVKNVAESMGGWLNHVKPHGALYHDIAQDAELAADFVQLMRQIDPELKIYLMAGTPAIEVCRAEGMTPVAEGFADRQYLRPDRLQSRAEPGAVLQDPDRIRAQVDDLCAGQVRTADGVLHPVEVASICLHSDTPGAVALAKLIHEHLEHKHVHIAAIR